MRGVREGGGQCETGTFCKSILIQSCSLNLRDVLVYFLFKNVGFRLLKGRYPNIWEVLQILKIVYSKHLFFYTMHNFHPQGSKKNFLRTSLIVHSQGPSFLIDRSFTGSLIPYWSLIYGVPHSSLIVHSRGPSFLIDRSFTGPSFLIYRSFLFLKISINKIMDEFVSSLQCQAIFLQFVHTGLPTKVETSKTTVWN